MYLVANAGISSFLKKILNFPNTTYTMTILKYQVGWNMCV